MKNTTKELYNKFDNEILVGGKVALVCIDIQYHDAAPGYGFFRVVEENDQQYEYYFKRLKNTLFPTVKKLQDLFRSKKQEIIHVRIEALTLDGRDRSLEHKRIGCLVPKGSKAAEFISEVAPKDDEIILSKTASGVFNSTNIDYILKNLGINQLIIVGVLTNECIETAVRDAGDRSYSVYIVEEGVAALNEELHNNSLKVLDGVYGKVISFNEAKEMISKI